MQVSRLFEMLYVLLSRERVTAAELARRFEVSVRTVYRDVQALSEAGVPIYAERGRDGGISVLPGYKLSKSLLSGSEREDILASLTAMAQTGAGERDTLRKLTAFLGVDAPDWVRIDLSDWSGTQGTLIATLKAAILGTQRLTFHYCSESGKQTDRLVCPLTLWFKGQAWYLRAYCLSRCAVRTFKLTRMRRVRIVPGEFPPEALVAKKAAIDPGSPWPKSSLVPLTLRADPCLAYRLCDDFGEEAITQQEDGTLLVQASFPPGEWIVFMILGYGEHAEILEPASLREEVALRLKKMCARYQS